MSTEVIRVLVVDDNDADRQMTERLLAKYPRVKFQISTAASGNEFREVVKRGGLDLVLLDHSMPGEDGISVLKSVRGNDAVPPIIMLTGSGDERVAAEAMRLGAYDYFPKSSITSQVLAQAIHQAMDKYRLDQQLENAESVIFALATAVEAKDQTTADHIERMSVMAPRLGSEIGLDAHQLTVLRYGGILHDIGKVAVSEAILRKPGKLDDEEWQEVYQHPEVGQRICGPLRFSGEVGPIIRHHHERWDGDGYVDGLAGEEIPLLARIISVVDAHDAMSQDRPYRGALPPEECCARLLEGAGSQWDPELVDVFIGLIREGVEDPHGHVPGKVTPVPAQT